MFACYKPMQLPSQKGLTATKSTMNCNSIEYVAETITIIVKILRFILIPNEKDSYPCNKSHLHVNLKIQLRILAFNTFLTESHDSGDLAMSEWLILVIFYFLFLVLLKGLFSYLRNPLRVCGNLGEVLEINKEQACHCSIQSIRWASFYIFLLFFFFPGHLYFLKS